MAATQHGTAYVYGVDALYFANAQIKSIQRINSMRNAEDVLDESGNAVCERMDDTTKEISATLFITSSFSEPAIGSLLTMIAGTFDGTYIIKSVTVRGTNKGFTEYTITAKSSEYIAL